MHDTRALKRDKRSLASEARFREHVSNHGGELLDDWLGVTAWHSVRCTEGHELKLQPHKAVRKSRLCRFCQPPKRSTRSISSEKRFYARLEDLGAQLLEPWSGACHPHRVRCSLGHVGFPRPSDVLNGCGPCSACSGRDTRHAESAFLRRLQEFGCRSISPGWHGSQHRYMIRCSRGHEAAQLATLVINGAHPCRICQGNTSAAAEHAFRTTVAKLGGEVLETEWLGSETPHAVRCPKGHVVTPRPHALTGGQGLCRKCKGLDWNAFYVVAGVAGIKFGITSRDGKQRLGRHKRAGYTEVVRLLTGMQPDEAPTLERVCLAAMADAKIAPIRGREYFPIEALPLALDIIDGWSLQGDEHEHRIRRTRASIPGRLAA